MSKDSPLPPRSSESDQLESSRRILSGFLARFTADRDLLITSVRACEAQLQALAARLEASRPGTDVPATESPALDEIKHFVEQLQDAHERAAAEAHATGERALASGDTALRSVEQLAATMQSETEKTGAVLAHVAADHAALVAAVEACKEAIETVSARVEANQASAGEAAARVEAAVQRCDQLAETLRTVTAPLEEVESLTRTVAQLVADRERLEAELGRVEQALAAPQDLLSTLAARVDSVDAAARQRCDQLAETLRTVTEPLEKVESLTRTVDQLVTDRERIEAELGRVKQALTKPQDLVSKLVARVDSVDAAVKELRKKTRERSGGRAIVGQAEEAPAAAPSPSVGLRSVTIGAALVIALLGVALFVQQNKPIPRSTGDVAAVRPQEQRAESASTTASQDATALQASGAPVLPQSSTSSHEAPAETQTQEVAPASGAAAQDAETHTAGGTEDTAAAAAAVSAGSDQPSASPAAPLVALEPEGATACIVQPSLNRACVYRRAASGIVPDECYSIAAAQVSVWPQWLVASDQTPKRIRLVDETGRRRLRIAPEGRSLSPDTAQLPAAGFAALSGKVTPWRTVWLVDDGAGSETPNPQAKQLPEALERWRQVWEQRRFDDYAGSYSASFVPQSDRDVDQWRTRKRNLFERSGDISVQLADVSMFMLAGGATAITTFDQSYRSAAPPAARSYKLLRWQHENGRWLITGETVLQEIPQSHRNP